MFCSKCGKPLENGAVCSCQQPASTTPALAVLKKALSSGLFLAVAILYTLVILFNLVYTMIPRDYTDMLEQYEGLYTEEEIQYVIDTFQYDIGMDLEHMSTFNIGTLIGMIPSILVCIGLWMLYVNAKATDGRPMRTTGLTLFKTSTIITLVCMCVLLGLLIVVFILVFALLGVAGESIAGADTMDAAAMSVVLAVFVVCLIVLVAVMIFLIFYYVKALKTFKAVKYTMLTGQPNDQVSMFLIVMMFIGAGFSALSGLTSLIMDPFSGLIVLADAVFICLGAYWLVDYRKQMKVLIYNQQPNPVFAQPSYPQQPQQTYQQQIYQASQPSYTITYTTCENCGQQYPSGSTTCPKCGAVNEKKS